MASTLIELARAGHEELEVGVNRIVKLLAAETKTHKQKLIQQVCVCVPTRALRVCVRASLRRLRERESVCVSVPVCCCASAYLCQSNAPRARVLEAARRTPRARVP
jgi:hypothetical protein